MASLRVGRGPGLALVARAVSVPVQVVVTVASTRLLLDGLGVSGFAAFAVLISLPNLISFAGLGVGAAVTDAVARRAGGDATAPVEGVLLTSLRALTAAGLVIAALSLLLTSLGAWSPIMGVGAEAGVNLGTGVAVALFGLSVPISLGQSVLLGAHLNHVSILSQTAGSVVGLLVLLVAHAARWPFVGYAAAPYLGLLAGSVLALLLARRLTGIRLRAPMRNLLRRVPGSPIRHLSAAMAWIVVFSTVATQSDRLVLGHLSTEAEVARYAVALSLLSACLSLVQAAGLSLWPVFAGERSRGAPVERRGFSRILLVFGAAGIVVLAGFVVAGPAVTGWVSNGLTPAGTGLMAACGVLVALQAVWWPIGMLLTDAQGLRGQAWANLVAAVVNVGVSVALVSRLGAVGPVLGTVAGTVLLIAWSRPRLRARLSPRTDGAPVAPA